tara:strand:- start:312 stop:530 length:219 start_codon:yes stop_codon:yes gene_type:complete
VSTQLPFFTCINNFRSNRYDKEVNKYFYCKEFGVPPFKGVYEDTPVKWITITTIIKQAINIIERRATKKKAK